MKVYHVLDDVVIEDEENHFYLSLEEAVELAQQILDVCGKIECPIQQQ